MWRYGQLYFPRLVIKWPTALYILYVAALIGGPVMAAFSGTIKNPVIVPTNTTTTPFSGVVVTDPIPSTENITVQLTPYYYGQGLGTLSDPMGGGSFDPATNTFTEAAFATGTPTSATQILNRLIYTPTRRARL